MHRDTYVYICQSYVEPATLLPNDVCGHAHTWTTSLTQTLTAVLLYPKQMLQKNLSRTVKEIDAKYAEDDANGMVPPHLVNQKLGNRQQVLIGGGKSFGSWVMTEMLATAGLLPGGEEFLSSKMHEDPVMRARLQRSVVVWDLMER
jgi:hypothetical protein